MNKTPNELPFSVFHCLQFLAESKAPVSRNFSIQYLRGNTKFPTNHQSYSPGLYGSLKDDPVYYLIAVFDYMVQQSYCNICNPYTGTFEISPNGEEYLLFPEPLRSNVSVFPAFNRLPLYRKLSQERKQLADSANIPEKKVCSDYFLEQMTKYETDTLVKLSALPGFAFWEQSQFANTFVMAIYQHLHNNHKGLKPTEEDQNLKKVKTPTFQDTKRLFLQGYSAEQIAEIKNIKETTVHRYLEILHKTGELNLENWLKGRYNQDIIERARVVFSIPDVQSLKEAADRLNMDYRDVRYLKILIA